jgi:hypothetical protein
MRRTLVAFLLKSGLALSLSVLCLSNSPMLFADEDPLQPGIYDCNPNPTACANAPAGQGGNSICAILDARCDTYGIITTVNCYCRVVIVPMGSNYCSCRR